MRDAKGKKEVSTWFLNFKTLLKPMGIIGGKGILNTETESPRNTKAMLKITDLEESLMELG